MRNTNKKGFTIIELVIVIAVIAILAAVLIPTFSGIIAKANLSADQRAVRDMNTVLAVEGALGGNDIFSVYDALSKAGMTAKNYTPLTKDTMFFYDANLKCILHVDANKTVISPKQYEGKVYDGTKDTWLSLNMQPMSTKAPEGFTETSTSVTVASAEELAYVIETVNNKIVAGEKNINLTIDLDGKTIDMMGANINIGALTFTVNNKVFSIKNGTIKNATAVDTSVYGDGKTEGNDGQYDTAGLITKIEGYSNVVLENLVIENLHVKNTHAGNVGILVGLNSGNLTIKNVKINNSSVIGHRSTGALVGYNTKNLTIDNVDLTNVDVKTVGGRSALLVGYQNGDGTIVSASGIDLENCSFDIYACDQNNNGTVTDGKIASWCYDGTIEKENKSYSFDKNALIMVPGTNGQEAANAQFGTVTGWN